MLSGAVSDAENSVDAGDPDDPVPTGGKIINPIKRRLLLRVEGVGQEIIRSRAIQFSANGYHDALFVLRHSHDQAWRDMLGYGFSAGEDHQIASLVDDVEIAIARFKHAFHVGIRQTGLRGVSFCVRIKTRDTSAAGN